ncbi:MAG: hypothetical protein J6W80_06075 [Kiritimatiellae bacterium]|nr:hypothetical protein [Kiritimatiellia bacterium]
MANEIDPMEGISLNDLRGQFESGTIQRVVVDEIHNHDDLISDVKWYPSSKDDRDETDYVVSKPKARHHMMGEGKLPSGFSTQTKATTPCRSYALLRILKERFQREQRKGKAYLNAYLATQVRMQVSSLAELMVMDILYGNRKNDPKGMNGLAAFYNTIGSITGAPLDYSTRTMNAFPSALSADGATNTSNLRDIFAVTFGKEAVKPFYPKMSESIGLDFGDKMVEVPDKDPKNGGTIWYLEREFNWEGGINIVNPTKAGRLVNLPLDKMATATGYAEELLQKLIRFTDLIKANKNQGEKTILYMDPMLWTEIKILLASLKWQNAFKDEDIDSVHKMELFGREVRTNESQAFAQSYSAP